MGFVFTWKKLSIRYGIRFFPFFTLRFLNSGYYIDNDGFRFFGRLEIKFLRLVENGFLFLKNRVFTTPSITILGYQSLWSIMIFEYRSAS